MEKNLILGAIIGDVWGSVYERKPTKHKEDVILDNRCHFTDDTAMTISNMKWLLSGDLSKEKLIECMHEVGNAYPNAGYGGKFFWWITKRKTEAYNSWGNGSAMRVSPVGWVFDNLEDVLKYAKISAEVTHNHPEGIKGAQAIAAAVFMARQGESKAKIKKYIEETFEYDLDRKLDDIKMSYSFEVSCQKSVPESIISFLESTDFVDAVKNAIAMAGDADTMGDMAGAIAEPYYGTKNEEIVNFVFKKLPSDFQNTIIEFSEKYANRN